MSEKATEGIAETNFLAKYPPPIKGSDFKKYWAKFIGDIVVRENFKPGHLEQLKSLCQMYVQQDDIIKVIEVTGWTYETMTRNGRQIKPLPEVAILARLRSQILEYSKTLGLVLTKDKAPSTESPGQDEWV